MYDIVRDKIVQLVHLSKEHSARLLVKHIEKLPPSSVVPQLVGEPALLHWYGMTKTTIAWSNTHIHSIIIISSKIISPYLYILYWCYSHFSIHFFLHIPFCTFNILIYHSDVLYYFVLAGTFIPCSQGYQNSTTHNQNILNTIQCKYHYMLNLLQPSSGLIIKIIKK